MTFQNFCLQNKTLLNNPDAMTVFDYLTLPENIHSMMVFSDLELPAISGIAGELELRFSASTPDFDLRNKTNRQIVGKMVRFILSFFSYEVAAKGAEERTKLRNFSKCEYFKTAAVYHKTNTPPQKHLVFSIR